jgi:hypothetical protein
MKVPVLILAYRRDEHLKKCLDALIEQGVTNIYVSQDGPKDSSDRSWKNTSKLIDTYRKLGLIANSQILGRNLGTLDGVQLGITWFLDQENFGLIIEDDIVLHHSALEDAGRLFEKMYLNPQVGAICLYPALPQSRRKELTQSSYRYSIFSNSFAWGTTTQKWNERIDTITPSSILRTIRYLQKKVGLEIALGWALYLAEERCKEFVLSNKFNRFGNWDIRWSNTFFLNSWIALVMNSNSVENIGWDNLATHTKKPTLEDLEHLVLDSPQYYWVEPINEFADLSTDRVSMARFGFIKKIRSIISIRSRAINFLKFLGRISHKNK